MPFVSFATPAPCWGVVGGAGVVDGRKLLGGACASLKAVIAAGRLDEAEEEAAGRKADFALEGLTYLPVIPDPEHIFCAGLNYAAHAAETGQAAPGFPRMFLRAPSSMLGHGAPVQRPKVSDRLDFEGELAVIIGRPGRHIAEADALSHIAGYTCFMDGSVRDWQEHTTTAGKNFFASGPLGPVMASARDIPDPTALTLVTRLNGEEVQRVTTDRMVHTIPALIAYCSAITPLRPGDVIATGTPEGIGNRRKPPLYMKAGDRIEVEISRIGELWNSVADEA
jgi:2-keto-4-pentenoate hydratase/2-oxohepta-3-ene-1,7-dioic acid hydratase in catechol pathway